jgi:hypothetical protein
MRDALIAGGIAFLAAKYGLEADTTKSLMVGAGCGVGAYYLLETMKHEEKPLF